MSSPAENGVVAVSRKRAALQTAMGGVFPPRWSPPSWPVSRLARNKVTTLLTSGPYVVADAEVQRKRAIGVELFFDWLSESPGATWQQRWLSVEADLVGTAWRQTRIAWLARLPRPVSWHQDFVSTALRMAISAEVLRPSLSWLVSGPLANGSLVRVLSRWRDPDGFARLAEHCDRDPWVAASAKARTHTLYRAALIMAAKGGGLTDIVVGDVLELLEAEADAGGITGEATLFYRMLHETGVLGEAAPPTLRQLRTVGQRSPEQLIDRYGLVCRPVRDLLVDYLKERQPALDYNSLVGLANLLGRLFWADLEAHHPGIDSLRLPIEVARAWKQRLRTVTKIVRTDVGDSEVIAPRLNYRECLAPVRAFYLDLAHWAIEDPQRWGAWVAPSPVGDDEGIRRKATRQRKARMDQRTRARLPALPALVRALNERRKSTADLLDAARRAEPGEAFTHGGERFIRRRGADGVWVGDLGAGRRRNLTSQETNAFWAWATVEILRATGIRVEELLELSHHSLVQYRLPTTGELIPLLQIAPSKTDAERLLVVSPELAEVLSAVIRRSRDAHGAVPLVPTYDDYERVWLAPAPRLLQRCIHGEHRGIAHASLLLLLTRAVAEIGLVDAVEGRPLHYTPHDFRRMFITDAIMSGLPPHIAQIIAGHQDINVTLGYKAVYPDEAIQAHLAFLARRRALRPSEEYRVPTDEEWQEFLGHFERRKVSIGTCARAFATPCIHEHACVRCPMLWPDPDQRPRLVEIRDNLVARIAEAEREGWLGEVEGLGVSLAGAEDKLAQMDGGSLRTVVDLPFPVVARPAPAKPKALSR
ncbi:MAG: tyrosine-type recombinase/integrase [Acidimicrobiales bacterium]